MVVEQEMAEIYPPDAEELSQMLPETDCGHCGFPSCIEFAEALLGRETDPYQCPDLHHRFADVLDAVLEMKTDPIPYNVMMEEEPCELIEINRPDKNSPLLITCNFRETVRIMREILESSGTQAFLLPTSTHGYSIDNAVHERLFKATEIWKAMKQNGVETRLERPVLVIPGLADGERNSIRQLTRCEVLVGPISGFLVPLFCLKMEPG